MKSLPVVLVIFFLGGMGLLFAFNLEPESVIDEWSIDLESKVESLPLCLDGKMPEGDWSREDIYSWSCRIDLLLTEVQ